MNVLKKAKVIEDKRQICKVCNGSGLENSEESCSACLGSGRVLNKDQKEKE